MAVAVLMVGVNLPGEKFVGAPGAPAGVGGAAFEAALEAAVEAEEAIEENSEAAAGLYFEAAGLYSEAAGLYSHQAPGLYLTKQAHLH